MRACAARRGNSAGAFFGTRRPRIRTRSLSRSFVTRSVTIRGVSRFASRRNRSVPLFFFTQPCGLRCTRSRRSSLFLRAAFFGGVRIGARPCFFGRRLHFFFVEPCPGPFQVLDLSRCVSWTCSPPSRSNCPCVRAHSFFPERLPVECSRAVFWRCFLRHRATSHARQYDAESNRQAFIFI